MGIITPVGGYIGAKPDFLGARPGVYRLDEHYELVKRLAWPIAIGTPMAGGYYAGTIEYGTEAWLGIGGERYHLIVSPKASGEASTILQYKTSTTCDGLRSNQSSAQSIWDGYHNTYTSVIGSSSVHPAANYCQSLSISGFTDWYLPSYEEAYLAFTNLLSLPDWQVGGTEEFEETGSSYFDGGFYWSSTGGDCDTNAPARGYVVPLQAKLAGMGKTESLWVRAIRRIPFIP